jgi:rhamnosyltransferase
VSAPPTISVIVRARDEAAELTRALEVIGAQRTGARRVELVVVDCGSRDESTRAAGERAGARVVQLPAGAFSYGGALNLGCANASGELLVALSAHAYPADDGWLARLAAAFDDPRVACASGDRYGPDGELLPGPRRQDAELARRRPEWGYSNAAGGVRAELWRRRPFRADLPASEDKEWALHWLDRGYVCKVDPALLVEHDHTQDPLPAIYRRARREWEATCVFNPPARHGLGALAGEWWSDTRWYDSALRARLSHRRLARLLGAYSGRRRAKRRAD